ncbi:MAG: branched-chain amino acid ABC transporter permease [Beijerinckiaceae bacterium]|nr:branched-chain amino acid ABC transporter permease [Beijerinckiaceae bacterium]
MRIFAGLAVVLLVLAPLAMPTYYVSVATQILIFAVLAMSVDVLAGFTGRTPLCHGAIFGTSTYVVLYTATVMHLPLPLAMLLGVLAATLLALVFGLLAVRTSGVYFLLLTLALGLIVWGICLRWTEVTGGENGLRGQLRAGLVLSTRELYVAVAIVVAVVTFAMWRFVRSPFGLTLRGIRDGESRMSSLGYNVPLHLTIAFTASGFFAGIAGALYAVFNDFVSPSTVQLSQSVAGLLMAIVGGVGTLFGAFVGSFLIIALEQAVSSVTERWLMALGLTFILIMIFAPEGVIGKARLIMAGRGQSKSKP